MDTQPWRSQEVCCTAPKLTSSRPESDAVYTELGLLGGVADAASLVIMSKRCPSIDPNEEGDRAIGLTSGRMPEAKHRGVVRGSI